MSWEGWVGFFTKDVGKKIGKNNNKKIGIKIKTIYKK